MCGKPSNETTFNSKCVCSSHKITEYVKISIPGIESAAFF
jgi:hypothetical protein